MKITAFFVLLAIPVLVAAQHIQPAPVVNPEIPSHLDFAGHRIDLSTDNMFERYDRELTALAYTHGTTLLTLKRAGKFRDEITAILQKNNVPSDLFYLACIESNLDPTAISPAKAAGLWQFMPATAREYGLEVNEDVDERFHTAKATEAACRYLKNAYARFGKWESVAAAYNAGSARIARELEAQHVESAYNLFLNNETSRYMFRLLAMKEVMEHPERYGYKLHSYQLYHNTDFNELSVDSAVVSWPDWAIEQGIDYLTLRQHNPWIRSRKLPNPDKKTYLIRIPTNQSRRRGNK